MRVSYRVFENKASYYAAHNPPNYTHAVSLWDVWEYAWGGDLVARCTTPEAAEAARRLLSGECERAKEPADEPDDYTLAELANQLIHDINHPTRCGFREDGGVKWAGRSVGRIWTLGFGEGLDEGAAQERAKIVAWLRGLLRVPHSAEVLASKIETGEADG